MNFELLKNDFKTMWDMCVENKNREKDIPNMNYTFAVLCAIAAQHITFENKYDDLIRKELLTLLTNFDTKLGVTGPKDIKYDDMISDTEHRLIDEFKGKDTITWINPCLMFKEIMAKMDDKNAT